ncbi:hypothetical protein LTS18_001575, partial [Coniosporium uncinatum]
RMFKQQSQLDNEEDEDRNDEETSKEWSEPSLIDFSAVPEEERKRNYKPYGGGEVDVESKEHEKQEDRERVTLLVHYLDRSEIPPCPQEPANPYTGEEVEIKNFGQPDAGTLARAARFAAPTETAAPTPDLTSLLSTLFQNQQQQSTSQHQQQQPQGQDYGNLANIFAQFANPTSSSAAVTPPPQFPAFTQPQPQPQAPEQPTGLEAIMAQLRSAGHQQGQQSSIPQAHLQQQQQPAQPFAGMPPVPSLPGTQQQQQQPPPVNPADLSALMAQMAQSSMPLPPPPPGFSFPGQQQPSTAALYEDPERKRMREREMRGGEEDVEIGNADGTDGYGNSGGAGGSSGVNGSGK